MAGQITVWYQCADCKTRRKGLPGALCCEKCGGEIREIGHIRQGRRRPRPRG